MVIILDGKTFLWLNIEAKINLWKSLARTFVLRLLNFAKREGPLCTLLDPCPLWDAKGQRCKKNRPYSSTKALWHCLPNFIHMHEEDWTGAERLPK